MIKINKSIVLTGTEAVVEQKVEIKPGELTERQEVYLIEQWDGSLEKVLAAYEADRISIVTEEGKCYTTTISDFNEMTEKAAKTISKIYER